MHTYINNNPYSATPHNNRLPFLFRVQHPTTSIYPINTSNIGKLISVIALKL